MKQNYQGVLERIKTVALAHPQVNSADDGRELEFDVNKSELFPRVFIRTDSGFTTGGIGSVEYGVILSILVMDRLKTDRSNTVDVLNMTHTIMNNLLANLQKDQLIRLTDNPTLTPLYDYQDTQTAGWTVVLRVYLDGAFECYPVPEP